jgi:predicted esterase
MESHVLARLRVEGVAFILPRAESGSWYDARAVDPLSGKTRSQLHAALDQLHAIRNSLEPKTPFVMAGFSQGACLTIEYAMAHGPWTGAMVAFTGCRLGTAADERQMADLGGMPVYLSGADADPWIPLAAYADAVHQLGMARARVRSDIYPGRGHEVGDSEIAVLEGILSKLASGGQAEW